ncbi:streptomycin 3'-adenylyltransferase [Allocatelliglobosispora scoriae]|uniref:Streptomycin 3'-adenylyltransferase n=1 Tax=Allocatelliglobosispora scoriae TaxID=643052 RepID=A0A841C2K5_9ACTN|nr:aminoglycoside adenylyltransferase domain-containing protein [Allocatelliglobosispora scoriae]MBB5874126.1 streptomycin 3'-adenylyltransferase [Allocatelliglobosispora scoriae]
MSTGSRAGVLAVPDPGYARRMVAAIGIPADVHAFVRELADALRAVRSDLVGVYVHGSAALGGFRPSASDVDVLAVVSASAPTAVQHCAGEAMASVGGCPATGLEMSVITAATAAEVGGCEFEVHLNTTGPAPVIVPGAGGPGDPDLVLHCAVSRDHAVAVVGPPARQVFGPVPRPRILSAMVDELRWAADHACGAYAVLNACRALRYAADGRLCSKVDGGEWYLSARAPDRIVAAALDLQRGGTKQVARGDAARFVEESCRALRGVGG